VKPRVVVVILMQLENVSSPTTSGLQSLGITDAEQILAAVAIEGIRSELLSQLKLRPNQLDQVLEAAREAVPARLAARLETPAEPNLALGALPPTPEIAARAAAYAPVVAPMPAAALPASVNRVSQMPMIRNQAARGTCVGFALTALHEFYNQVQGQPQDFSEEELYYETKQIDGAPAICGTWQFYAVQVLANHGQCRESVWGYNPNPPCNQPGPPPPGAAPDAAAFKRVTQFLSARDVSAIKTAIAQGSVATLSIPVYNSWYLSEETRRTGRITMRIGNEIAAGGHAVCLVGYQDDATAPGGGYFLLRNSWGTVLFGAESPYGPGYGTIPYQYIADESWESYTVQVSAGGAGDLKRADTQGAARTITIETGGNFNIIIR
jgi:hypothetical protein